MENNRKRWFYLGVGTLLLIFCGLIYGWSLFREPFGQVYTTWTLSQLSMTFTISMTFFCLGGFAAGKLSAKLPPRVIIMMSAVLLLAGFFGVSRMNPQDPSGSLPMLYLCYGVLGGTGVGFSYNSVIGTMNKWFSDKPGTASGIMLMGFGLGALILGSVATSLISSQGIFRTFLILGIAIFVVLMIGSLFIKAPETQSGKVASAPAEGKTAGEMLKTSSFWIFLIWCIVGNSAGLMVINSAASIAVLFGAPAIVGMVVSVFNGAGRVLIGGIFDKVGRKTTMLINMIALLAGGIALFMGAKTVAMALILVGLLCMGIAYGGFPTITSAFINRQYGPKYFPTNFSLANFSLISAAILGPMISSKLVESAGGAYDTTFMAIIICGIGTLLLWVLLNKACAKEEQK